MQKPFGMELRSLWKAVAFPVAFVVFALTSCAQSGRSPYYVSGETVSYGTISGEAVTVYPTEIEDVLHNPDMGWVLLDYAMPDFINCGRTGTYPEWDVVGVTSCWSELEPEEGKYNWSLVDKAVEYWSGIGKRINFRISTDAMILSGWFGYVGGVPEWLFTKYKVHYQQRYDQGLTYKVPDYTDPVYKKKLGNFLKAWSDRYKNNPYIDTVDLLGYGTWGEWHSGHDFASYEAREAALKDIIDKWYTAWDEKKILILSTAFEWRDEIEPAVAYPADYNSYKKWSAFDYALTKPGIAWFRTGAGGCLGQWDSKFLLDFWKTNRKLPIMMEFFQTYAQYKLPGGFSGYTPDSALDEALMYHPNYITNMGFDGDAFATKFYRDRPDLTSKGNKMMGYRFVLAKASYPPEVAQGKTFTLEQTWINRAMGRSIRKWPLKVFLTDAEDKEIWSAMDKTFDQTSFVNGEVYNVSSHFTLPADIAAGTYDFKIAMADDTGNPGIKLAIADKDPETRYKIGSITVLDKISEFKSSSNEKTTEAMVEDFRTGTFSGTGLKAGAAGGSITKASSRVVDGIYSAYGSAPRSTEWAEFLKTDFTKLPFQKNSVYEVTFNYKVSSIPGDGGYFTFLARTDNGGFSHDKGVVAWLDEAGSKGTKTIRFATDSYDDYYLAWGMHFGGGIAIDNIKITRLEGCIYDSFEEGLFSSSNYNGGQGGIITGDSGGVLNGNYSVYCKMTSGESLEFCISDPSKVKLAPNTTYEVTFRYKPCGDVGPGGYYYFLARTGEGGPSKDKGMTQWMDKPGTDAMTKTIIFTTEDYSDYRLVWGIHNNGAVAIDEIILRQE